MTAERVDVLFGVFITNVVGALIVVACAATLYATGIFNIASAADAAQALSRSQATSRPCCSPSACWPRHSWGSVSCRSPVPIPRPRCSAGSRAWTGAWREAPAFYGLLAFFIGFAALFMLIPGLPLIQVMFGAQVLNGLLLPVILVFVMLLVGDKKIMGDLVSGRINLFLGWGVTDPADHHVARPGHYLLLELRRR